MKCPSATGRPRLPSTRSKTDELSCSIRRCRKSAPAWVWIAAGAWRFRSVATRLEKSDREGLPTRPDTPSAAHSSTADRRRTERRRAQRFWTIPHAYRMHVQREFLISPISSDAEVRRPKHARPPRQELKPLRPAARAAKRDPMKLSRTVGLAVANSLPRFLPPPTRRIAP